MRGMGKPVKLKKRVTRFSVNLDTSERLALEMLANERGLSASDIVRQYIRDASKQLHRDAPA